MLRRDCEAYMEQSEDDDKCGRRQRHGHGGRRQGGGGGGGEGFWGGGGGGVGGGGGGGRRGVFVFGDGGQRHGLPSTDTGTMTSFTVSMDPPPDGRDLRRRRRRPVTETGGCGPRAPSDPRCRGGPAACRTLEWGGLDGTTRSGSPRRARTPPQDADRRCHRGVILAAIVSTFWFAEGPARSKTRGRRHRPPIGRPIRAARRTLRPTRPSSEPPRGRRPPARHMRRRDV